MNLVALKHPPLVIPGGGNASKHVHIHFHKQLPQACCTGCQMFTLDILSSSSVLQWVLAWSTCHSDIMTEIREWEGRAREIERKRSERAREVA